MSPMQGSQFRIIVWKPLLNIVFKFKLSDRPAADRGDKCHEHDKPKALSLTPEITFFKEVRHWSPSARLRRRGMLINP